MCGIRVGTRRTPVGADLDHRVTLFHSFGRSTGHLRRCCIAGTTDARVHTHAVPPPAAEQLRKTLTRDLPENVPERDINAGDRFRLRSHHAQLVSGEIHALPQAVAVQRVLPQYEWLERIGYHAGDRPGIHRTRLAIPRDSLVGSHDHKQ